MAGTRRLTSPQFNTRRQRDVPNGQACRYAFFARCARAVQSHTAHWRRSYEMRDIISCLQSLEPATKPSRRASTSLGRALLMVQRAVERLSAAGRLLPI
jgi:hypothetical protein